MRNLDATDHARLRLQLVLLPVYLWLFYGWMVILVRVTHFEPVRDFAHFYVQGVVAHDHDAHALYDRDELAAVLRRVIPGGDVRFPPVYGPQVSVFFSLSPACPYMRAMYVWLGLSLLHVCGLRLRGLAGLSSTSRPSAGRLSCSWRPLRPCIFLLAFEQMSAVGLLCVTAAFLALRADRLFVAGVAIGSPRV